MAGQGMEIEHEIAARRDSDQIMTTESDLIHPIRPLSNASKPLFPGLPRLDTPAANDLGTFPNHAQRPPEASHYRKVTVNDLLNNPSPILHPMWQLPSIQEIEIDPSFARMQQRYHLLNSLYHVCQYASSTYSRFVLPQHRNRSSYWQSNFHPYSGFSPARDPNLMDNISTICTHIWRKARSDLMAPRRAEADAVKIMRDTYEWGETILKGVEGNWVSGDDSENGSLLGCAGIGEVAKFGDAAKKLCEWFEDAEAWRSCVEIVDELEELEDWDGGERMSCDWESGDTFGR